MIALVLGCVLGVVGAALINWLRPVIPAAEISVQLIVGTTLLALVVDLCVEWLFLAQLRAMVSTKVRGVTSVSGFRNAVIELVQTYAGSRLAAACCAVSFVTTATSGNPVIALICGVVVLGAVYFIGLADLKTSTAWWMVASSAGVGVIVSSLAGGIAAPAIAVGVASGIVLGLFATKGALTLKLMSAENSSMMVGLAGIVQGIIMLIVATQ